MTLKFEELCFLEMILSYGFQYKTLHEKHAVVYWSEKSQ